MAETLRLMLGANRNFRVSTAAAGGTAANQLAPQDMNEFDRRVLLEALRQAHALQQ